MSTSKDGLRKVSKVPKETSTSKTSSRRESSTDRTNAKTKKETQKIADSASSKYLGNISEQNDKPKKSSISTKVKSRSDEASSYISANIPSKPVQKESTTSSRKVISRSQKDPSTAATKVSSNTEKVPVKNPTRASSTATSKTSSQNIKKSNSKSKTLSKKESNHETPSTPSSSRISKSQYFPSKNLYSNALKHTDIPENISKEITGPQRREEKTLKNSTKEHGGKKQISSSKITKSALMDNSRSVRSVVPNLKKPSERESSLDTNSISERPRTSTLKENTDSVLKEERRLKNSTKEERGKHISSSKVTKGASMDSLRSISSIVPNVQKPSERESSPETSSVSERPRTATLRKGSIVNANIVGPEAPESKEVRIKDHMLVKKQSAIVNENVASLANSDDNYEDDFDSYESDFEAYSSSEDKSNLAKISGEETSSVSSSSEYVSEKDDLSPKILGSKNKKVLATLTDDERAPDSGTFELPDFKHNRILENIKESVERENIFLEEVKRKEKANLSSLSDEGFEDQHSLQFINFADARRKCEKKKASQLRRKRGEEILGMIKLDNVNFTIYDSPAVPYEVYISSYGQNNTIQASAQTGDDDISEEVQTEAVEVHSKWTQMPIKFSSFDQNQENFWINYKKEYLGVGAEILTDNHLNKVEQLNIKRLKTFLNQSVDVISDILAEANIGNLEKLSKNERNIPFSKGYLQFNTIQDIFKDTAVHYISVFSKNINHILTVHVRKDDSVDFIKSIVSVWDISDFNTPRTNLVSYGEVSCATFSLDTSEYIFAGQNDGALLVWNIKEKGKIYDIPSRTPTVTTDIGSSHFTKVVSIQPVKDNEEPKGYFEKPENNELCSMDEDGEILIWSFYTDHKSRKSTSDVLINTATISLQELYPEMPDLLCSDFILSDKHIYVSTNYGYILHCLLNVNGRNVKKFVPATKIDATCLEPCPFSSSFFLAGYSNGNTTLYSKNTERPLMVLRNNEKIVNTSVQIIQWSKTKPFVLYTKDNRNTIHIWDLSKSDMFPEYSIPFKENICCLKLSPVINIEQEDTSYMLIGTDDGKLYLHLLNKEYGQESYEAYKNHVATFLNYVSRL